MFTQHTVFKGLIYFLNICVHGHRCPHPFSLHLHQGGMIFEKKLGTCQIVPNCCRTPIPKYHLLQMHAFRGAIFSCNPKLSETNFRPRYLPPSHGSFVAHQYLMCTLLYSSLLGTSWLQTAHIPPIPLSPLAVAQLHCLLYFSMH